MTAFNQSHVNRILDELYKYNRLRFNELLRKSKVPHGTFVSTLNKLKHAKKVDNEVTVRNGKVVSEYFLTATDFKQKRLWGIDERISTKREDKSLSSYNSKGQPDYNKKRKTYLLLLLLYKAVFGSTYQYVTSNLERHPVTLSFRTEQGISQQDLVSQGVMGMNRAFLYIDFTEAEVKQCFKQLKRHYPPILEPRTTKVPNIKAKDVDDDNTRRFGISDKSLRNLMLDIYAGIFPNTVLRMENTWLYVRDPEQGSGETNWYLSLFGEKSVVDFINRVLEIRNKLDKKNWEEKSAMKAVILDEIKKYDNAITHFYKQIMSKRNEGIRKRYDVVIDPMLEIVYPQFLRELHKNNKI